MPPFLNFGEVYMSDRNFIGIELEKKYFDIASDRIKEVVENKRNNNV